MIKKIGISFLLMLSLICSTIFVSSCAQSASSSLPEPLYARAMTENILLAINNDDYALYSKNLDSAMKQAMTQQAFDQVQSTIATKVGSYEPGSIQFVQAISQDPYIAVIYSSKFTNEQDNVTVTISFHTVDGNDLVGGLYFNSPKLRN
jgi:hypothetical protein